MKNQIQPSRFKLSIPINVENKIRYICSRIRKREWSGVLFYKTSGYFEKENLNVLCKDFIVLNIGTSSYTEFTYSPKVVEHMANNPELLDCNLGLIHSHNDMPTFFSTTDLDTLLQEGIDTKNFVSLIVNNAGIYTAAITRKETIKDILNRTITYNDFGKENKTQTTDLTITEIVTFHKLNVDVQIEEFLKKEKENIQKLKELAKINSEDFF